MSTPKKPSSTAKKQVSKFGSSNTPVLSKLIYEKIDSEEEEELLPSSKSFGQMTLMKKSTTM